jgi:hypothetical protein
MVDQVVVAGKHPVREPVVAHEFPHVLDCVSMVPLYAGFLLRMAEELGSGCPLLI